jgi:Mn2+/Fe2+ NRAMP family transporter
MLSLGALIVFFVHLFAFGILAVTIAAYELVVFSSGRRPFAKRVIDLFVAALPFLPAIVLLVLFSPHSSSSAIIKYRDLWTRILAFAAPILYDWRSEAVGYCVLDALLL